MKKTLKAVITILCIVLAACLVLLFVLERGERVPAAIQATTWEEFQALSEEEQMRFIDSFGDGDGFEQWMNTVHPTQEATLPWEQEGAKPIEDYTWEAFEALEQQQQEQFIDSFTGGMTFDQWLEREKPQEQQAVPELSFDEKRPEEYTWEEFEALQQQQQEQFIDSFTGDMTFDQWLERENPQQAMEESSQELEKKPEDYTWEEFEALDQQHQEQFIDSFTGDMTFEQWLEREKPQEMSNDTFLEGGSKMPEDYTWADFQELTEEQQMAFIDYMDARDGFEKWMEANKPKD